MLRRKTRATERGQSFVEFSLSLVLILLILSGLLDLGRIYLIFVALVDGAGEAALYLSINPGCRTASDIPDPLNPSLCADPNNAEYRARNSGGQVVAWPNANISVETTSPYGVGDPVAVTIEYSFHLLTPVIPKISGVNPITLTAQARQIILSETVKTTP